jgi:hypothetical protein
VAADTERFHLETVIDHPGPVITNLDGGGPHFAIFSPSDRPS